MRSSDRPRWSSRRRLGHICIDFELLTLAVIRDKLTLNVLMLLLPVDAIKDWQANI